MKKFKMMLCLFTMCSIQACAQINNETIKPEQIEDLGKSIKECGINSVKFDYKNDHIFLKCRIGNEPLNLVMDLCGIWSCLTLDVALKLHKQYGMKISADTTWLFGTNKKSGFELVFDTNYTNMMHRYIFNSIEIDKQSVFRFDDHTDGFINPISNNDKRILFINYQDQYLTFYFTNQEKDSIRKDLTAKHAHKLPLFLGFAGKPYCEFPIEIGVNGKKVNVHWKLWLDTGLNSDLDLFTDTAGFNMHDIPSDKQRNLYTLKDTITATFASIKLFNNVIDSCNIRIDKSRTQMINHEKTVGLIGNGILDRFYVWIDFEQKNLYLIENPYKKVNYTKVSSHRNMKIAYKYRGSDIFVTEVVAYGRCGMQGLHPNDLITAIDNKPVSNLSKPEIKNILDNDEYKNAVVLDIERKGKKMQLHIPSVE